MWVLLGLVGIGSTPVTWSRAVNLWFYRNRGLALGITLVGTSLAAMVVPPLTVYAIGEFGWRTAYPVVAMLPLFVALPIAILFFREPTAEVRRTGGRGRRQRSPASLRGLHSYRFWVIFASILLVAFATGGHVRMQILAAKAFTRPPSSWAGSAWHPLRPHLPVPADRWGRRWHCRSCACRRYLRAALGRLADPAARLRRSVVPQFAAGAETDLVAYLAGRCSAWPTTARSGMLYVPFGMASAVSPAAYGWVRCHGTYSARSSAPPCSCSSGARCCCCSRSVSSSRSDIDGATGHITADGFEALTSQDFGIIRADEGLAGGAPWMSNGDRGPRSRRRRGARPGLGTGLTRSAGPRRCDHRGVVVLRAPSHSVPAALCRLSTRRLLTRQAAAALGDTVILLLMGAFMLSNPSEVRLRSTRSA
jgi:hypothetical protein